MARLLTMPREYANSMTHSGMPGAYAGAPVVAFRYRASNGFRLIACSIRSCRVRQKVPASISAARLIAMNFGGVSTRLYRAMEDLDKGKSGPQISCDANRLAPEKFSFQKACL